MHGIKLFETLKQKYKKQRLKYFEMLGRKPQK
jgi:hypothetical protein